MTLFAGIKKEYILNDEYTGAELMALYGLSLNSYNMAYIYNSKASIIFSLMGIVRSCDASYENKKRLINLAISSLIDKQDPIFYDNDLHKRKKFLNVSNMLSENKNENIYIPLNEVQRFFDFNSNIRFMNLFQFYTRFLTLFTKYLDGKGKPLDISVCSYSLEKISEITQFFPATAIKYLDFLCDNKILFKIKRKRINTLTGNYYQPSNVFCRYKDKDKLLELLKDNIKDNNSDLSKFDDMNDRVLHGEKYSKNKMEQLTQYLFYKNIDILEGIDQSTNGKLISMDHLKDYSYVVEDKEVFNDFCSNYIS